MAAFDLSRTFYIRPVLVFLTVTALLAACIHPEPQGAPQPVIISQSAGGDNQLLASMEQNALLIDIYSATGIGKATITMTTGLPVTATLRLHLAGLEHLQVSNDVATVVAQVSSQGDHAISQALAEAATPAAAQPISADHPLWLTIEPASAAQPYFTVILPAAFLVKGDQRITIEWVDFYR